MYFLKPIKGYYMSNMCYGDIPLYILVLRGDKWYAGKLNDTHDEYTDIGPTLGFWSENEAVAWISAITNQ